MDMGERIITKKEVKTMKAYLSGAMEYAGDEGAGWRSEMTHWLDKALGHTVYNPVIESDRLIKSHGADNYRIWKTENPVRYRDFIRKCVDSDLQTVTQNCDYLICLWDESVFKGAGTHGEVTMAYHSDIPVYLVNRVPIEDFSGWIMACSTEIFHDFETLKRFLKKHYG